MRIFVSSTFEDLKDYREATLRALKKLDHVGDDMIFWSADERQPLDLSLERVRQSELLVLLIAHRYGYIPPGSDVSITEAEYAAARVAGIPVLAFFLDESVPWPPALVDRANYEKLAQFKERVSTENVRATFRSADDLGAAVTLALIQFERRRKPVPMSDPLGGRTLRVSAPVRIRTDPDLIVPIGLSEDGLPLLLRIQRGADLGPAFEELGRLVTRQGSPSPAARLAVFRQELEDFGAEAWARAHLEQVAMSDGTRPELYVTRSTLSEMFTSLLSRLLSARLAADSTYGNFASFDAQVPMRSTVKTTASPVPALESAGGSNRFLGISPEGGSLHSVGTAREQTVQWRPFVSESLTEAFPAARSRQLEVTLGDRDHYTRSLFDVGKLMARPTGRIDLNVDVYVRAQDIAGCLAQVSDAVADLHRSGRVHGDLKPQNVLLGAGGPKLIDGFSMTPGTFAPGWTPRWSAPEQVLGLEVSEASDLYPMGVMISHLIDAELVGEVRKFRTRPARAAGRDEFDVFYDPRLTPAGGLAPKTFNAWAQLAMRCLRFDPEQRNLNATELSALIRELAADHPLPGSRNISLTGGLVGAEMPVVARLITDARERSAAGSGLLDTAEQIG